MAWRTGHAGAHAFARRVPANVAVRARSRAGGRLHLSRFAGHARSRPAGVAEAAGRAVLAGDGAGSIRGSARPAELAGGLRHPVLERARFAVAAGPSAGLPLHLSRSAVRAVRSTAARRMPARSAKAAALRALGAGELAAGTELAAFACGTTGVESLRAQLAGDGARAVLELSGPALQAGEQPRLRSVLSFRAARASALPRPVLEGARGAVHAADAAGFAVRTPRAFFAGAPLRVGPGARPARRARSCGLRAHRPRGARRALLRAARRRKAARCARLAARLPSGVLVCARRAEVSLRGPVRGNVLTPSAGSALRSSHGRAVPASDARDAAARSLAVGVAAARAGLTRGSAFFRGEGACATVVALHSAGRGELPLGARGAPVADTECACCARFARERSRAGCPPGCARDALHRASSVLSEATGLTGLAARTCAAVLVPPGGARGARDGARPREAACPAVRAPVRASGVREAARDAARAAARPFRPLEPAPWAPLAGVVRRVAARPARGAADGSRAGRLAVGARTAGPLTAFPLEPPGSAGAAEAQPALAGVAPRRAEVAGLVRASVGEPAGRARGAGGATLAAAVRSFSAVEAARRAARGRVPPSGTLHAGAGSCSSRIRAGAAALAGRPAFSAGEHSCGTRRARGRPLGGLEVARAARNAGFGEPGHRTGAPFRARLAGVMAVLVVHVAARFAVDAAHVVGVRPFALPADGARHATRSRRDLAGGAGPATLPAGERIVPSLLAGRAAAHACGVGEGAGRAGLTLAPARLPRVRSFGAALAGRLPPPVVVQPGTARFARARACAAHVRLEPPSLAELAARRTGAVLVFPDGAADAAVPAPVLARTARIGRPVHGHVPHEVVVPEAARATGKLVPQFSIKREGRRRGEAVAAPAEADIDGLVVASVEPLARGR